MSLAIDTKECMFFVGGNSAKSTNPAGSAFAGGCTKNWWNSQPNIDTVAGKQTSMGKLMGTDGEPIYEYSYGLKHYEHIDGNVRFEHTSGFSDAEVGMLLYYDDYYGVLPNLGVFEIIEVGEGYIVIDEPWVASLDNYNDDNAVVYVGGAWSELDTLVDSYLDAVDYTQEVWVNKDLAPASQWDWSGWSGTTEKNTWMKITGFHRIPGDVTDTGGAYFQTVKDMFENGVDSDCLVEVDCNGFGASNFIDESSANNIHMSGFNFCNGVAGGKMFKGGSSSFYNVDMSHCAFEVTAKWSIWNGRNILFFDCFLEHSDTYTGSQVFDIQNGLVAFYNSYFKNLDAFGTSVYEGICFIRNSILQLREGSSDEFVIADTASGFYSHNNTYVGFDGSKAVMSTVGLDSTLVSINDLIHNRDKISPAYALGWLGGTFVIKNPCVYAEDGQLNDVMVTDPTSPFTTSISDTPGIVEVDPLLDIAYQPRNKKVLLGGTEVGGQKTTIGAISQEHQFVGRSLKSNPGRLGIFK